MTDNTPNTLRQRRQRRTKSALAACVLTITMLQTGCTTSEPEPVESTDFTLPKPLPPATATDTLPLDSYRVSQDDGNKLRHQYEQLVIACADQFRVSLTPVRTDPQSVDDDSKMWAGTFGTLTISHAKKYGYHAAPGDPFRQPFTVFTREDENPQTAVIYGGKSNLVDKNTGDAVPPGGCRGAAVREMGVDALNLDPPELKQFRLKALRDGRTATARQSWSRCMRQAGFTYDSIDGPVDKVLGVKLTAKERATAVADVTCTKQSRWYDTAFSLQAQMQQADLEQKPDYYETRLKAQQKALRDPKS